MVNVADKWTTNDILDKLGCHRTTVIREAEKLGIVPERLGGMLLFTKVEADQIIEQIKFRRCKRSK
jgi:hypothetical protein